ncbi:MAG: MFS transporter [Methanoregula sp.]
MAQNPPQHPDIPVLPVMLCLTLGAFMSTLDTSIVSVSLPSVTSDLQVSPDLTSWILVVYLLFSSSFLMTMGSLGDRLGHRRVFLFGFFYLYALLTPLRSCP